MLKIQREELLQPGDMLYQRFRIYHEPTVSAGFARQVTGLRTLGDAVHTAEASLQHIGLWEEYSCREEGLQRPVDFRHHSQASSQPTPGSSILDTNSAGRATIGARCLEGHTVSQHLLWGGQPARLTEAPQTSTPANCSLHLGPVGPPHTSVASNACGAAAKAQPSSSAPLHSCISACR